MMLYRQLIGLSLIILIMLVSLRASFSIAQTVSSSLKVNVSATVVGDPPEVPDTVVRFIGRAYPGADVTLRQNGSVLATIQADPQANFDVSKIIAPGTYTFTIFAEDSDGTIGRDFNITLSLTEGATTTITGIFLGPTISTNKAVVQVGDTINVLGYTVPSSTVTITINSHNTLSIAANADSSGAYLEQFIGGQGDLHIGDHTARSKSTAPDNALSENSETVAFTVGDTADDCAGKLPGDINCDGFVNLVDFSIFLFYWQQTNPAEPRADINSDNVVNVTDFSIMLFNWTG
jgi:hypothetical protein